MGVSFSQSVMILVGSFRDRFSFLVRGLRLRSGVAYSALLQTIAKASVWKVLAFAPQVDRERHRIKLFLPSLFHVVLLCVVYMLAVGPVLLQDILGVGCEGG